MEDERRVQELIQKGLKELQLMKVRFAPDLSLCSEDRHEHRDMLSLEVDGEGYSCARARARKTERLDTALLKLSAIEGPYRADKSGSVATNGNKPVLRAGSTGGRGWSIGMFRPTTLT